MQIKKYNPKIMNSRDQQNNAGGGKESASRLSRMVRQAHEEEVVTGEPEDVLMD